MGYFTLEIKVWYAIKHKISDKQTTLSSIDIKDCDLLTWFIRIILSWHSVWRKIWNLDGLDGHWMLDGIIRYINLNS